MDLDVLQHRGDAVGAIGVAGQQDVLRQLTGCQVDVVLALPGRQRHAGSASVTAAPRTRPSPSAEPAANDRHPREEASSGPLLALLRAGRVPAGDGTGEPAGHRPPGSGRRARTWPPRGMCPRARCPWRSRRPVRRCPWATSRPRCPGRTDRGGARECQTGGPGRSAALATSAWHGTSVERLHRARDVHDLARGEGILRHRQPVGQADGRLPGAVTEDDRLVRDGGHRGTHPDAPTDQPPQVSQAGDDRAVGGMPAEGRRIAVGGAASSDVPASARSSPVVSPSPSSRPRPAPGPGARHRRNGARPRSAGRTPWARHAARCP